MNVMRAPEFGGKQGWRSPVNPDFAETDALVGFCGTPKPSAQDPIPADKHAPIAAPHAPLLLNRPGQPTGAEVHDAVPGTRNMVGQTIGTLIEARFEALQRENAALRWMTGLGFTALAILTALLKLLD